MAKKKVSSKKAKDKQQKATNQENIFSLIKQAVKSEQLPAAVGIGFFLIALFLFVSIVSYFVAYVTQYDAFMHIDASSLLEENSIHNWAGRLGAFLSYEITKYTFGVGSLGFVLLLCLFGLLCLKVKIKYFSKWLVATIVFMLWISCLFGLVVVCFDRTDLACFAGIVGVGLNELLEKYISIFGCITLFLAFSIFIPMLLFNVRYLWVKNTIVKINKNAKEKAEQRKQHVKTEEVVTKIKPQHREKPPKEIEQQENIVQQESLNEQNREELKQPHNEPKEIEQEEQLPYQEDDIPFTVHNPSEQEQVEEQTEEDEPVTPTINTLDEPFNPRDELRYYELPSTDLLIDYDKNNVVVSERELLANKQRIINTLKNYNIEIASIEASVGPTVTLYEIKPAPGIRIAKIKNLEDDIALSLSALGIRIIAPIPGRGTIGIEVPNSKPQIVSMKSMLESSQFRDNKFELPIALGRKIDNTPYVTDLAKMPHLLVAGATGQGKSVGLNAIISSLLYKKHPAELKFVFVDPKKVELSLYSKLEKHYLAKIPDNPEAVITETTWVERTLNSLCVLMDKRYELLKAAQCKKITEYNKKFCAKKLSPLKGHEYMPYIVLVIDEFADLIMTSGKKIEKPICRLAQLARAVGIHLIIATQRPSVNIITGTIKANFPARIAFKVSSLTDSRTILDQKGAEQLVGKGDMLISDGGGLTRLQCALIDTDEIEEIANFIGNQQGYADCFELPDAPLEADTEQGSSKKEMDDKFDALFEEAARMVVLTQQGSTSMLQRKLSLGYNRAGRVMDQLEAAHIVGSFQGSKARPVLVSTEEELNDILLQLKEKGQIS